MNKSIRNAVDENGVAQWLLGFEDRYDAARRKREAAAARPRATTDYDAQVRARSERRLVMERMEHGYRLQWPREIAGRVREPFTEHGFRSEGNSILRLFISRLPKGGKARASDDKANLYVPYRSKMLTLDCAYIEANKTVMGMIRLDCDAVFASKEACLHEFERLVHSKAIPHLPHIVTGDRMPDGTFRNPHFIFMLPDDAPVWNDPSDKRCREKPVRLFDGVSRGLAQAMIPIGVDPHAPRLTMRMKNPISPIWETFTPNMGKFMTLSEYAKCVNTRATPESLARQAAVVQSKLGVTPSNITFNALRDRAATLLREWHFAADPRMAESRDRLADYLHEELERHADETSLDDTGTSYVVGKVASYMALHFDVRRIQSPQKARHRLLHEVDGVDSVAKRQRIGAAYTARVRRSRTLDKLVSVYRAALGRGEELSVSRLAELAKVSRATAYRAYRECVAMCMDAREYTPDRDQVEAVAPAAPVAPVAAEAAPTLCDTLGIEADVDDEARELIEHDAWIASLTDADVSDDDRDAEPQEYRWHDLRYAPPEHTISVPD